MTPEDPSVPGLGPEEAQRLVDAGAVLVDVREDEEWDAGHAPQAIHLPMGLVADRSGELPTGRTIVCVCRVGGRSGTVAAALGGAGYDARNLEGGMLAWEQAGLPVVLADGGVGRVV